MAVLQQYLEKTLKNVFWTVVSKQRIYEERKKEEKTFTHIHINENQLTSKTTRKCLHL